MPSMWKCHRHVGREGLGKGREALGKGSFEQHFRELLTTLGLGMAGKKASRGRQEPKWHEAGWVAAQPPEGPENSC